MAEPTVFVFTGRAYFKYPGVEYRMSGVGADFVRTRRFTGEWVQAERWLVANGYRRLWGRACATMGVR